MRLIVGIDDTDTKETRGTGFNAREIGSLIEKGNIGSVEGIVRHQLFFDPRIPFTSANSSASIEVECESEVNLRELCLDYLNRIAPVGSDIGLCISKIESITNEIINWGERAKTEVLTQDEARHIAKAAGIYLQDDGRNPSENRGRRMRGATPPVVRIGLNDAGSQDGRAAGRDAV